MHPVLSNNLFLVKEHVGIFKASNNFDIYDPTTQQKVLECREPHLGIISKLLRFTDYKRMTPFHVVVTTPQGQKVLSVKRGISLFWSNVQVLDENDAVVGMFKQKLLTIGGKFEVLDAAGNHVCMLKGKWTSWSFSFMKGDNELASVAKKWAGLGKEMFTTADNYMLSIQPTVKSDAQVRTLILAAVLCIDMVLKE
jgi:uncharacterized protein YxjI